MGGQRGGAKQKIWSMGGAPPHALKRENPDMSPLIIELGIFEHDESNCQE
jgi:hypothetical protein